MINPFAESNIFVLAQCKAFSFWLPIDQVTIDI